MTIKNEFDIDQIVYLKTDRNQEPRMVTQLVVSKAEVRYELSSGVEFSVHHNYEISAEENTLMRVG